MSAWRTVCSVFTGCGIALLVVIVTAVAAVALFAIVSILS